MPQADNSIVQARCLCFGESVTGTVLATFQVKSRLLPLSPRTSERLSESLNNNETITLAKSNYGKVLNFPPVNNKHKACTCLYVRN